MGQIIHRRLNSNEDDAIAFLNEYNTEYGALVNQYVIASWNYETNLTDENANAVVSVYIPIFVPLNTALYSNRISMIGSSRRSCRSLL